MAAESVEAGELVLRLLPSHGIHEAEFLADRREAEVCVVVAEDQAVFGTAREHAIRLGGSLGHEVVHEHTEIGISTAEDQRRFALQFKRGICAGKEPLPCGFLVAGGSVDLSGEIQAGDRLGFESVAELGRRAVVVFDGVSGTEQFGIFESGHGSDECVLDFQRQRR